MKYFNPENDKKLFSCSCGCSDFVGISSELLFKLDTARGLAGIPFSITSGPRCEAHNKASGGSERSAHLKGEAADIAVHSGGERFLIIEAAIDAGFNRIGIAKTFVHVDVSRTNTQKVVWLY
jgi:zinc D-Ala-D-Ala carboxypeptidase